MNLFDIIIDDKHYELIDKVIYQGRTFISFFDEETIYIKEYEESEKKVKIYDIPDETYTIIKELMNL